MAHWLPIGKRFEAMESQDYTDVKNSLLCSPWRCAKRMNRVYAMNDKSPGRKTIPGSWRSGNRQIRIPNRLLNSSRLQRFFLFLTVGCFLVINAVCPGRQLRRQPRRQAEGHNHNSTELTHGRHVEAMTSFTQPWPKLSDTKRGHLDWRSSQQR